MLSPTIGIKFRPIALENVMSLSYQKLEEIYLSLKNNMLKERMTWKFLLKNDKTGLFLRLHSISPGLKPLVALESLKENRGCRMCRKHLAKFKVCSVCLKTEEGRKFSRNLRDTLFKANWSKKPHEEIEKIVRKREVTSLKNWGVNQPFHSSEVQEKIKRSLLRNLGVDNPFKSDWIKENIKESSRRKFGVENVSQSPEVKAKKVQTCLSNRGVKNPSQAVDVKEKKIISSILRFGYRHPTQSPIVKKRTRQHNRKVWGENHPRQNAEFFDRVNKLGFVYRAVRINGKLLQVQGYENRVLKCLEPNIKRISVRHTVMPRLIYFDHCRPRRYYPDALIETIDGRNILLEVKSTWTLSRSGVLEKARSAFKFCSDFSNLWYMIAVYQPSKGIEWITSFNELRNRIFNHVTPRLSQ